jgi:hypothetical protein
MRLATIASAAINAKHVVGIDAAPAFGRADFHGAYFRTDPHRCKFLRASHRL